MNAKVESVAAGLGIGVFELYSRARAGYGEARDSARTAYNRYIAIGEVPDFVWRFVHHYEEKKIHAEYLRTSGRRLAVVNGHS